MKKILILLSLSLLFTPIFATGAQDGEDAPKVFEIAIQATKDNQIEALTKIFNGIVDRYNAENGTNYELLILSDQGKDLINTRMSSNDKPDIFHLDSPADATQYANDGLLLNLTDASKQYGWEDKLFNWAFDLAKVGGEVYTLPYGYEGMVLWYNKEVMTDLGLNADDIDTFAEYEDALQKAQDNGYIPVMLGTQDWPWAQEWYLSTMFSYTSREAVKSAIEGVTKWNTPAFKKTVELYKSWHDKKFLADGKSYILTSDDAINAFTSGKALFKLEGTWAPYWIVPLEKADQDKIGVMLHPAINDVEKPHMPLALGGMWAASADTKYPELAAYIISSMLDQDIQGIYLKNGLDIAPMVVDKSLFDELIPVAQNMWGIVNDALANGDFGYTTWAFYPPETRMYLYEEIVNVLEGNISIDDYLNEMDRLTTEELATGFIPVVPSSK